MRTRIPHVHVQGFLAPAFTRQSGRTSPHLRLAVWNRFHTPTTLRTSPNPAENPPRADLDTDSVTTAAHLAMPIFNAKIPLAATRVPSSSRRLQVPRPSPRATVLSDSFPTRRRQNTKAFPVLNSTSRRHEASGKRRPHRRLTSRRPTSALDRQGWRRELPKIRSTRSPNTPATLIGALKFRRTSTSSGSLRRGRPSTPVSACFNRLEPLLDISQFDGKHRPPQDARPPIDLTQSIK